MSEASIEFSSDELDIINELKIIDELARKAADGKKEALKALCEHKYFGHRLRAICRLIAGNRRLRGFLIDPLELEQEAMKKICERIDSFEGRSSFITWVSPIVNNVSVDLQRQYIRYDRFRKTQEDMAGNAESRANTVERRLNDRIDVQQAISKLPAIDRRIVKLRSESYTIVEIAKIVNLSPAQTQRRLKKSQQILLQYLGKR